MQVPGHRFKVIDSAKAPCSGHLHRISYPNKLNSIPPKLGPPTPFGRTSCEAQRHEFSQRHNREAAEFYIKECRFKDIDLYIDLDIDLDIVFGA